jgi:glutamate-1-semialdehyde aminotransferase
MTQHTALLSETQTADAIVRPDLCAWSKAIANGYALAALTGNDRFREAATKVFVTGSFWCGTVAMAAARATRARRTCPGISARWA